MSGVPAMKDMAVEILQQLGHQDGLAIGGHQAPQPGRAVQRDLGRRHGAEGIQKYTESQNVTVQHGPGFAIPKSISQKTWAR